MIHTLGAGTAPAAIARGRLKHSWLENEVLNKTPETVVLLRREVGWPALQRFPANVQQALTLADEVEFGFSPARLVDDCAPLAALSEDQRTIIREAAHAAYLKCFDAQAAAQCMRVNAECMTTTLSALLAEWNQPDEALSDLRLRERWCAVLDAAVPLCKALDALPKGIVLP